MGYRAAIANLIDVVEGTTPTSMYARNKSFKYQARAVDVEGMSDQANRTRRFVVVPSGSYELSGAMRQLTEPGEVTETVTLAIAYAQNDDPSELYIVMREDLDLLAHRIRLTSLFDRTNAKLQRRIVSGSSMDIDNNAGGTAVLTINIEHQYRPVFTEQ